MSYILDALRKSEQQRQQGAAPITRLTQVTETAQKRALFSMNGMLAVALVGVGALIGWLRPWQSEPSMPTPSPVVAATLSAPSAPSMPSAANMPSAPVAQPVAPVASLPPMVDVPDRVVVTMEPPVQPAQVSPPIPAARPESPAAAATPATMALAELPDSVRREIPDMTVSLHGYADVPKDRIVMVNGTLLHEGEDIAPGFRLERITPDGVIIGYKGYRFRRGLRQ